MIEHANIIYMPNISPLGGIETYVYEMVKRYKDRDIAVVCKKVDLKQRRRIQKYAPVYVHKGEHIKCKTCLINYDQSILDYVEGDVYQVFHADYSSPIYEEKPKPDPRIKGYIAITKYLQRKMSDLLGVEVMMSYNPLEVEDEDFITIVTASRLHKNKGPELMQKFIDEMERQGIKYVWYVITCDKDVVKGKNVVFIDNRLDVAKWTSKATYGALFSKSEACSYFINEMLYRNIPMIVTPLPYLEEIGVEDGKNAYIVEFDGSNVAEVVAKLKNVPKFKFKRLEDSYDSILSKDKSTYEPNGKVKVKCRAFYTDMQLGRNVNPGEEFEVDEDRADHLISLNLVEEC